MAASIASWAPCHKGRPFAMTSMRRASATGTSRFMSASRTLRASLAPASRHTRARARVASTLDVAQAVRWSPSASSCPQQLHLRGASGRGSPGGGAAGGRERGHWARSLKKKIALVEADSRAVPQRSAEGIVERTDPLRQGDDVDVIKEGEDGLAVAEFTLQVTKRAVLSRRYPTMYIRWGRSKTAGGGARDGRAGPRASRNMIERANGINGEDGGA